MPALPVPTDAELEELARALETPDIPSKLRCGICDLLAFDTMRLPCCSTNICDKCYNNELSEECIICCHKPLDKTLCEPNKPMRITIKALLKRKFNDRVKKNHEAAKASSASASKREVEEVTPATEADSKAATALPEEQVNGITTVNDGREPNVPTESSVTQPQTSEVLNDGMADHSSQADETASQAESEVEIITEMAVDQDQDITDDNFTSPMYSNFPQSDQMNGMNGANNTDFTNGANGMFPMDFASMMAAASSMMPMAGFQNMMGMGMMPMMSQMFGNFDNSNMGMNGMNMDGMEGFQGQNQYGGGNGSWMNNNQANFNGNFGASSGYNMSAHQNNYNQMNDQAYANHDFSRGYGRQGFQNRRGRRGYYNSGFGRGSYQGNNQYGYSNQNQSYPAQSIRAGQENAGSDRATAQDDSHNETPAGESAPSNEHDFNAETGPRRTEAQELPSEHNPDDSTNMSLQDADHVKPSQDTHTSKHLEQVATTAEQANGVDAIEDVKVHHIQAFVSDESRSQPTLSTDSKPVVNGMAREAGSGSSAPGPLSTASPIEPRGVGVIGAPTGPRALREGLPNTGRSGLRYGQPVKPAAPSPIISEFKQPFPAVSEAKHDTVPRERSLSPEQHTRSRHRHSRSPSQEDQEMSGEHDGYHSRRHRESRQEYEEERPSRSSAYKHSNHEDEDDSRRSKHRSHHHRDEDVDTESRERHSHKRSRREHEEDEGERHRRSSKRSRHHHDEEEALVSRKHHRERSRSSERRPLQKDRHSRRKDHHGEHHRRKQYDNDNEPTPTSAHSFSYPEESLEPAPSRRKPSHRETEEEDCHENRYPAHERAPLRRTTTTSSKGTSSKPNTPLISTFPPTQASRRDSHASESAQRRPISRSAAKGPFAALASQDPPRSNTNHRHPSNKDSSLPNGHNSSIRNNDDTTKPNPSISRPEKDPHTLEREARDRERLQREMQRRAFMDTGNAGAASKRRNQAPSGSRRVVYKFEDEGGMEARRVEREREAGRW